MIPSIPMNRDKDLILKADESSTVPKWTASMPTPELIRKGLSLNALQNEVIALNEVSKQNTGFVPHAWIGAIPIIAGFVLCCVAGPSFNTPLIMVGFGLFFAGGIVFGFFGYHRAKNIQKGFEKTRMYIEMTLNQKYQSLGIRWSVADEQRVNTHSHYGHGHNANHPHSMHHKHHRGSGFGGGGYYGQTTTTTVVHHIIISSVEPIQVNALQLAPNCVVGMDSVQVNAPQMPQHINWDAENEVADEGINEPPTTWQ